MVTEALSLAMRTLLAAAAAAAVLVVFGTARGDDGAGGFDATPALERADMLFAQQRYDEAVAVLEVLVDAAPPDARVHLLLGKSYGRLAEQAPWYRAMILARRCGVELARAVELAPRNREALEALARFYEEAPAVLGGGADKAAAIRQRLEMLDRG